MIRSKIPKHIWLGVVLPLVLVGLGIWRLGPKIEEYRREDENKAMSSLITLSTYFNPNTAGNSVTTVSWCEWTDRFGFGAVEFIELPVSVVNSNEVQLSPLTHGHAPTHGYYFLALDRNNSTNPPRLIALCYHASAWRPMEEATQKASEEHDRPVPGFFL